MPKRNPSDPEMGYTELFKRQKTLPAAARSLTVSPKMKGYLLEYAFKHSKLI